MISKGVIIVDTVDPDPEFVLMLRDGAADYINRSGLCGPQFSDEERDRMYHSILTMIGPHTLGVLAETWLEANTAWRRG